MKRKVVSVADVNRYVKRLLEEDYVLSEVWVSGEVSNCKYHHTGHIYFTLKDALASLNVVMFAKESQKLDFQLQEGMQIYAKIRITLYEKTGAYQGYISEIERQGVGTLYEAFEQLKGKLLKEGLFENTYKKTLPQYPIRVGVVTSKTGAAVKDIIQVAKKRNPGVSLYIYPVHVQGTQAKDEIVSAIELANRQQMVDILIVGRGGGSIEDLWAFNEECVARAIFNSHIPIVSAVGHEVDFTIADFVADKRAATPSAAAELVIPDKEKHLEHIVYYQTYLQQCMAHKLSGLKSQVEHILSRPVYTQKKRKIQEYYLDVIAQTNKLDKAYKHNIDLKNYQLINQVNKLDGLSPLKVLSRGYALATKEDGTSISTIQDVAIGECLKLTLAEGTLTSRVERKGD